MKKIILILLLIAFASCQNKKKYKYIETVNDESITGEIEKKDEDPIVFESDNDSLAYLEAYRKFCISQKIFFDSKMKSIKTYTEPLEYKIFDADGKDITMNQFKFSIEKAKEEIRKSIISMDNIYENLETNNSTQNIKPKIDSAKIKELKPFFKSKTDEFSSDKTTWITPKSAPPYRNQNGTYLYFSANNLRFVFQYHRDNWLFINSCQFLIDGKVFEFTPNEVKRDNDESGITEWFDENINYSNNDLIEALANAKSAKVKLVGDKYVDIKVISKNQIQSFKRTLEYYKALGYGFSSL